ncbi:MAG: TadE/TadG family type IV pilus assembly protein [Sulfitobacter sp.]
MMRRLLAPLRRFTRREDGSVTTIEFVIVIPVVFTALLMSIEMGVFSLRQMWLDRGVETTVRYIRLNTNQPLEHDDLKDMICEAAGFLPDCNQILRLEMKPVVPRNFAAFDESADCVDISQEVTPERGLTLGQSHELMMLRACYMFEPVFASSTLGKRLEKDGAGRVKMLSIGAFVQEPG